MPAAQRWDRLIPTVRATTVYLGLGSNVGDRDGHLRQALQRLRAVPGLEVVRVSKVRETAFVGEGPVQGPFKNAVAEVRTKLPAPALLGVL